MTHLIKRLVTLALIPVLLVIVSPSILAESIDWRTCSEGDVLIKKISTGNHACVSEGAGEILEERG